MDTEPTKTEDTPKKTFAESYVDYVKSMCESEDCYPQPALIDKGDEGIHMYALAVPPEQIVSMLLKDARNHKVRKMAFGLDRYAKPNQGTELSSVFTYIILERGAEPVYGLVEYDGEGDVRERKLGPDDYWYRLLTTVAELNSVVKAFEESLAH